MSVVIYVADLPEFAPVVDGARQQASCTISKTANGYWKIESPHQIRFVRKELGMGPALWNSALSGGFRGRIVGFDRNEMCLQAEHG
mgnify:CR=1 FL=1